jgi:hypothetical protein
MSMKQADENITEVSESIEVEDSTSVATPSIDDPSLKVTSVPIADLRPHPLQVSGEYYGMPSKDDFDRLFRDIVKNGLHDPIQVLPGDNEAGLPAFTILDGHCRVEVYKEKLRRDSCDPEIAEKFSRIDAIVRHDLVEKSADEIARVYLEYNDNRRQLHMLDRVHITRGIYERERGQRRPNAAQTRDVVGKRLGISGVTLSRWMRADNAPQVVRDLLKRGVVPLMAAARVGGLDAEAQQQIAEELTGPAADVAAANTRRAKIAARKSVLAVIDRYVDRPGRRHTTVDGALNSLLTALQHGTEDLKGRTRKLFVPAEALPVLAAASPLIASLLKRAKASKRLEPARQRAMAQGMEDLAALLGKL